MRVAIPEEIKQARRVNQERDRIVAQAQAEAERIVSMAQQQASFLMQDHEIIRQAEEKAQRIINEASLKAQEMQEEADAYALTILSGLEEELDRLLGQTRNGIRKLKKDV